MVIESKKSISVELENNGVIVSDKELQIVALEYLSKWEKDMVLNVPHKILNHKGILLLYFYNEIIPTEYEIDLLRILWTNAGEESEPIRFVNQNGDEFFEID